MLVSGLSCPWQPQSPHIDVRKLNGSPSGPRAQCCQEVFRNIVSCDACVFVSVGFAFWFWSRELLVGFCFICKTIRRVCSKSCKHPWQPMVGRRKFLDATLIVSSQSLSKGVASNGIPLSAADQFKGGVGIPQAGNLTVATNLGACRSNPGN